MKLFILSLIIAVGILSVISFTVYTIWLIRQSKRIKFIAKWFDLWVGFYWDSKKRRLYFLPIPGLGFYIQFGEEK